MCIYVYLYTYVVMINFMCQLNWVMGCSDILLNLISECLCMFLEEINI